MQCVIKGCWNMESGDVILYVEVHNSGAIREVLVSDTPKAHKDVEDFVHTYEGLENVKVSNVTMDGVDTTTIIANRSKL